MQIDDFFTDSGASLSFSREQASLFAKQAANDFNPLHDADAKLFCVPGDLLFSVALRKYGLFQNMSFQFTGMVTDGLVLNFDQSEPGHSKLQDSQEKTYLEISREGAVTHNYEKIWAFVSNYILFSGHNFPHILVPLMSNSGVMLNPKRPLAIYESMSFSLDTLDFEKVSLELKEATLDVNGKKGRVCLEFEMTGKTGGVIGKGQKEMLLRGLQPLDQVVVDQMVTDYEGFKR